MNAEVGVTVTVDMEVVAGLPDGWTQDELFDALVQAGNDPKSMIRNDDGTITVYRTENDDG